MIHSKMIKNITYLQTFFDLPVLFFHRLGLLYLMVLLFFFFVESTFLCTFYSSELGTASMTCPLLRRLFYSPILCAASVLSPAFCRLLHTSVFLLTSWCSLVHLPQSPVFFLKRLCPLLDSAASSCVGII